MNNEDLRKSLINQLANSVGMKDSNQTGYTQSRYDKGTGTLYCKGYAISSGVINEAKAYFQKLQSQYDISNPDSRKIIMFYEVALQSIEMMQKENNTDASSNNRP